MKGDFSRRGYDPDQHFSRVLMQQGRVLLDTDWNAQTSMLLHYLRSAIRDFAGAVRSIDDAFKLASLSDPVTGNALDTDFSIAPGHLYVYGLLCENPTTTPPSTYTNQPYLPSGPDQGSIVGPHLVYIDVWEQHITHVQDERIREVALGGPDTTTRARTTWQVKLWKLEDPASNSCAAVQTNWGELLKRWQPAFRGALKAETKEPSGPAADDPCITAPGARYRGPANRLYRIEIHEGGSVDDDASFKWSRENGSVVFPVISLAGTEVKVESMGRGDLQTLAPGTWVELVDDQTELRPHPTLPAGHLPGQLAIVDAVDSVDGTVELTPASGSLTPYTEDATTNPLLRRWDYQHQLDVDGSQAADGAIAIKENAWITLEDGIAVWFDATPNGSEPHRYRTGDYWLIPARTAAGDIEWPTDDSDQAILSPPHGVEHHYASLGIFDDGAIEHCLHAGP